MSCWPCLQGTFNTFRSAVESRVAKGPHISVHGAAPAIYRRLVYLYACVLLAVETPFNTNGASVLHNAISMYKRLLNHYNVCPFCFRLEVSDNILRMRQ